MNRKIEIIRRAATLLSISTNASAGNAEYHEHAQALRDVAAELERDEADADALAADLQLDAIADADAIDAFYETVNALEMLPVRMRQAMDTMARKKKVA